MAQIRVSTWGCAAVAGLAAGLLWAPAAEARVGGSPEPVTATGAFDAEQVKRVTVTCPLGTRRYAGGGAVDHGGSGGAGVALTAIEPDAGGASITVTAAAVPGHTRPWALTAFAVCAPSVTPWRIAKAGAGTATATCPGETRLFGLGFRVAGVPSAAHVREIALDPGLTRVRVTAGGPAADTTEVTAIALCRPAAADMRRVLAATGRAGWPKTVARQDSDPDVAAFATGATVTGPAAATLDAVVPDSGDGTTWVRGTLAVRGPAAPAGPFRGAGDDQDGSVTVDAALIGTFH
jgi:hypothetical protein